MTNKLRSAICEQLSISENQLNRLILRAPHAYKVYTIPKKTGGHRTIAQPAKETKILQAWIIENILSKLPIHNSAAAYKSGASIKKNALAHCEHAYLSKFDFKDFFTSIRASDVNAHLTKHLSSLLSEEDRNDVVRICCFSQKGLDELRLSIGAPSSPIISNTIMYEFDSRISSWCEERSITYTRYADDLAFSTNVKGICSDIEPAIRGIVRDLAYPSLRFNNKKTTHLSKKNQRRITGLILSNEGKVSLGRERKREISALIHKHTLNLLPQSEVFRLQGLLGFARDVEPLFVARVAGKYGSSVIEAIFKERKERIQMKPADSQE